MFGSSSTIVCLLSTVCLGAASDPLPPSAVVSAQPEQGISPTGAEERRYDGLTLTEWRERIQTLRFDEPAAAAAVPGLIALLRDESLPWFTRRQAALTLGRIGQPAASALPVLSDLLLTISPEAEPPAQWAAKACALLGPVAAPLTPALREVLEDPRRNHFDRLTTIEALARIGGAHAEAIPTLIRMAQSEPGNSREVGELREAAVESLSLVGPPAAPAVPILLRLTRQPDGRLRKKAVSSLQAIGPSADVAAPILAELAIFDELPEVREAAGLALSKLGPAGEWTLAHLVSDRDPQVRALAAGRSGRFPSPTTSQSTHSGPPCRIRSRRSASRRPSRCGD